METAQKNVAEATTAQAMQDAIFDLHSQITGCRPVDEAESEAALRGCEDAILSPDEADVTQVPEDIDYAYEQFRDRRREVDEQFYREEMYRREMEEEERFYRQME